MIAQRHFPRTPFASSAVGRRQVWTCALDDAARVGAAMAAGRAPGQGDLMLLSLSVLAAVRAAFPAQDPQGAARVFLRLAGEIPREAMLRATPARGVQLAEAARRCRDLLEAETEAAVSAWRRQFPDEEH